MYTDWSKAQEQIRGFTRPRYRKFSTKEEAEEFVKEGRERPPPVGFGVSKKSTGPHGIRSENPKDADGVEFAPGEGPLPEGAEDGFDPNVLLDPATGKVVYKTAAQKAATKTQPTGSPGMLRIYTDGSSLRHGTALASAGVGVYFGPGDSRFVFLSPFLAHFKATSVLLTYIGSSQQECFRATKRKPTNKSARRVNRNPTRY